MGKLKYSILILGLFVGATAFAAEITWGTAFGYTNANDVSTQGSLVEAVNACGSTSPQSPVVRGVSFIAQPDLMSGDANTTFFYGDTGDSEYNILLNTLDYDDNQFVIGADLLGHGTEYLIQIWYVDERGGDAGDRSMAFGDGNGNVSPWVDDGYVTGTFIADSESQTITVDGSDNSGGGATSHISAYQLRDLSSPVPTLSTTAGDTVASHFTVLISFSESVTGLTLGDFEVINGSATEISGSGISWSVTISPASNGDVTVLLPAGSVTDDSGHTNIASNTMLTTYVAPGSEQPVPTLSTASNAVYGDYTVWVDFSENVTGLTVDDFVVTNGSAVGVTGSGASYAVEISPNFGGDISVMLPRKSVMDEDDGLQNIASDLLVVTYYVNVTVSSLSELQVYLPQDHVNCVMTPGTYRITAADVTAGLYEDYTAMLGRNHKILLKFSGSNSTYDFTDVTLEVESGVWMQDYGNNGVYQLQTTGNDNVLLNLTMVDDGTVDDDPVDGCVNVVMDGRNNRIEGFHMSIKGSYPYGYGDSFGKGGSNVTIPHNKHSAFLIRGESNHAKNCTLIHRSYGHAMFMQAASNPIIEGCYIEGEMRSTDDMLAETSGPAYDIDFMTTWGYRLPPGYMKSTGEGGIRAYNAGETLIDGVEYDRGTSNPTIIDNTIVNMRTGVTLTHASGTKYVSGCSTIGCERGYAIGSGIIENCNSDVQYGPAFGVDYESDSGVTADITIIPHVGPHYNGSRHFAYIYGSNHNLTFRGTVFNPEQDLEINVGGDKRIESALYTNIILSANGIVINNLTGYPLILDGAASDITGQSAGTVTNNGTGNSIVMKTWSVTSNLTFYGEATQSSTSYDALASLAIDQNTSGEFGEGSVTHTANEDQPWWRIDLKRTVDISEIRIWNRTDSNSGRLSDYDVTVFDQNEQVVWTSYQENNPDPMVSLNTGSVTGQVVMIQLRGSERLSVAEVEILGVELIRDVESIAHWPLDEGAGSIVYDISGNGFDGTVSNAVWVTDQLGGAIDFDGSSSVMNIPSAVFHSISNEISISLWSLGGDLQPKNNSIFFARDAAGDRVLNIHLPYSDSRIYWDAGQTNGYDRIALEATSAEFKGAWSHWVFTKNAALGEMKIYLNGELWHSGSGQTRIIGGITQATIGAQPSGLHYDGMIGDVKLFNQALTDVEVSALYLMPDLHIPSFDPELVVSTEHFGATFSGTIGQHYQLEFTSDLTHSSSWQVATDLVSLARSPMEVVVSITNDVGYYRVRWIP